MSMFRKIMVGMLVAIGFNVFFIQPSYSAAHCKKEVIRYVSCVALPISLDFPDIAASFPVNTQYSMESLNQARTQISYWTQKLNVIGIGGSSFNDSFTDTPEEAESQVTTDDSFFSSKLSESFIRQDNTTEEEAKLAIRKAKRAYNAVMWVAAHLFDLSKYVEGLKGDYENIVSQSKEDGSQKANVKYSADLLMDYNRIDKKFTYYSAILKIFVTERMAYMTHRYNVNKKDYDQSVQ